MASRKTYDVEQLRKQINRRLADKHLPEDAKRELCSLLESVLHATGNYHGFNNLWWMEQGCKDWRVAGCPEGRMKEHFIIGEARDGYGEYAREYFGK